jgi:hypothetical protein
MKRRRLKLALIMITPFERRLHWAGAVTVKHIANINPAG